VSARGLIVVASLGAIAAALYLAFTRQAQASISEGGPFVSSTAVVEWVDRAARELVVIGEQAGAELASAADGAVGLVDDTIYQATGSRIMSARWLEQSYTPEYRPLLDAMRAAEVKHGIPYDLIVRLAWQESRWNPAAHNAGSNASGIMQIVPRWHPGVDPWDAYAAIDYGAGFLAQLYRQFGTWELALKAYNWGPGNVKAWLDSGRVSPTEPIETQRYSAQILSDLADAGRVIA